jgi:ADP-ribose pyrophosphatase YjhB (NUDIX family)
MEVERITVAVGAVIEDREGRILLVKHRPERGGFWQGRWICPGGGLELGETIEDGIKREVMEETHLEIRLTIPLIPYERIVKSEGQTLLHVIYIVHRAELTGGELKPDSDVGEGIWVPKEDIPHLWQELHDDTRVLLQIAGLV